MLPRARRIAAAVLALALPVGLTGAERQMEGLGRGVVAILREDGKVFVGWRLLGTDPEGLAFNLYRSAGGGAPVKLNREPLSGPTSFLDVEAKVDQSNAYFVRPVLAGEEGAASAPFSLKAHSPPRPYLSLSLRTPEGYQPNDASAGDLDGDGEYEIVLHQVSRGRDNSQSGMTGEPILEAYRLDGAFLWRINLGKNIREGAHYTQFMVYDLDGDGRAEVATKTADGTVDGQGKVIGDAGADHRSRQGRAEGKVLAGPE
jgi:rhamnogalacturonan endolyase